jgi:hypothetical protein
MYQHTQSGRVILVTLGVCTALAVIVAVAFRDPAVLVVCGAVVAVFLAAAVMCSSLTVTVDERELVVRFGPGPIRKRIALSSIVAARPVVNPWWYGYGIHHTPEGWLWNVSGQHAVEVTLHGGRRLRVGTDEPQALVEAIERTRRAAPAR